MARREAREGYTRSARPHGAGSYRDEVQEDLAVSVRTPQLGRRLGSNSDGVVCAPGAKAGERRIDRALVSDDPALPHLRAPDLELRLEQRDDLGPGRRATDRRKDLLETDER